MSITRTTVTDDIGDDVSGTPITNAWLQTVWDTLDARWSRASITSTGSQNNVSVSEADLVILNNASDLTITGIVAPASPAKPGKRLVLISTGAGNVFLAHQSGSSTAANRLINFATTGNTPLAAGVGCAIYVYDDNASRWRLVQHEQGAWITPTFAAGNYTASAAGAWTLASGDVTTQAYYVQGRRVHIMFYLITTSVTQSGGDPTSLVMSNALWGSFTTARTALTPVVYNDNGAGNTVGYIQSSAGGTSAIIQKLNAAQWATAANTTNVFGQAVLEVT